MDPADAFEPFLYGDYLWATTTQFVEFKGMEGLRRPRRAGNADTPRPAAALERLAFDPITMADARSSPVLEPRSGSSCRFRLYIGLRLLPGSPTDPWGSASALAVLAGACS